MTPHQQLRLVNWRLKILHEAAAAAAAAAAPRSVSSVCRRYGISRKTFYKWKKRYVAQGEAGLRDQHCGPHRCPRATAPEIVQKILYLRQHQHYSFGPGRISMSLMRFRLCSGRVTRPA